GVAKVLLGVCGGKKLDDKREDLKKAEVARDLRRGMHRR
ncbi:MAG: SsrA-binding protein, partial [Pirellulales bacterium]|nr:SsrA-binding protein [Pirellulales bacterium]